MKAAGVITVNSLGTAVNPGDGQCTLIEAIRSANADASSGAGFNECPGGSGTDTILVPAGVIAVQIHGGPPSEAWYKDITLLDLSSK